MSNMFMIVRYIHTGMSHCTQDKRERERERESK